MTTRRTKAPDRCRDCQEMLPPLPAHLAWRSVYLCEECLAKRKAAWREEHTRTPGDTRKGWLIGDLCRVTLAKVAYEARILDMSDVAEGDYMWTQLELSKTGTAFGTPASQTWTHPKPVQSYKLRKRLLKDEAL